MIFLLFIPFDAKLSTVYKSFYVDIYILCLRSLPFCHYHCRCCWCWRRHCHCRFRFFGRQRHGYKSSVMVCIPGKGGGWMKGKKFMQQHRNEWYERAKGGTGKVYSGRNISAIKINFQVWKNLKCKLCLSADMQTTTHTHIEYTQHTDILWEIVCHTAGTQSIVRSTVVDCHCLSWCCLPYALCIIVWISTVPRQNMRQCKRLYAIRCRKSKYMHMQTHKVPSFRFFSFSFSHSSAFILPWLLLNPVTVQCD